MRDPSDASPGGGYQQNPLATTPRTFARIVLGETHIDWDACDITVNGVHCTSFRQVNREMWHHLAETRGRKPPTLRQRIAAWLRRSQCASQPEHNAPEPSETCSSPHQAGS